MNRAVSTVSEYVKRLEQMKPFVVSEVGPDGELTPYLEIRGEQIIPAVVISEHDLGGQVERVSAEIAWWSRLAAQCDVVVQYKERKYAIWKSRFRLDHAGDEHPTTGKKVTLAQLEDLYRVSDEYSAINDELERVREALRSCEGVVEAFRAKRELLMRTVWRAQDGSLHGLQI